MTIVKSNLCPTCGGPLDIDLDKQMYVCPFCGVTFDYDYFREDNVKEVASKAVSRSEYGSAKDAYDFMLAKDPHDFEALRGLFLCETKWKGMDQMRTGSEVHVSADSRISRRSARLLKNFNITGTLRTKQRASTKRKRKSRRHCTNFRRNSI